MQSDTRYDEYFAAILAAEPAATARDRTVRLQEAFNAVEAHLRQSGSAPDTVEADVNAALQAAGRLDASFQAQVPGPKTVLERVRSTACFVKEGLLRPKRLLALGLVLIAYIAPLIAFVQEGVDSHPPTDLRGRDIAIELKIAVADFSKDVFTLHVVPAAGPLLQDGRLTQDVNLQIEAGDQPHAHIYKANAPLTPWTIVVPADSGDVLNYPLDRYHLELQIRASTEQGPLRTVSALDHLPHGLRAKVSEAYLSDGGADVAIVVQRSNVIIFIVALSMASLGLVCTAVSLVAWHVVYRDRKIEFSMMTWAAALLFVIPAVRNSLPGGAPLGALIDYVAFFWLQIVVVIAMSKLVWTWLQRKS